MATVYLVGNNWNPTGGLLDTDDGTRTIPDTTSNFGPWRTPAWSVPYPGYTVSANFYDEVPSTPYEEVQKRWNLYYHAKIVGLAPFLPPKSRRGEKPRLTYARIPGAKLVRKAAAPSWMRSHKRTIRRLLS